LSPVFIHTTKPLSQLSPSSVPQASALTLPPFPNDSKRCERCSMYYTEPENHGRACGFHPGEFIVTYRSGLMSNVTVGFWTCCKDDDAHATHCSFGRHVEDLAITAKLKLFDANRTLPNETPFSTPLPPAADPEQILDEPFESHLFVRKPDGDLFYKHAVSPYDTLSGLSLKFGVKAGDLRRANGIFDDNAIHTMPMLLVPWKKGRKVPPPDLSLEERAALDQERKVKRFGDMVGCTPTEAKYYLEAANWDLEVAKAERNRDVAFEQTLDESARRKKSVKV